MIITIQLDGSNAEDRELLNRLLNGVEPAKPAKPAKAPKPVEPPPANPDPAPAATVTQSEQPAAPASELGSVNLAADAPAEIVKLAASTTKETLGDAVLATSKAKGRATIVGILEKYRPKGYEGQVVRVSAMDPAQYPKLAADILALFAA